MRKIDFLSLLLSFSLVCVSAFALQAPAPQIKGQYLETRSADVYVGQCFANGEVNLTGNEAIVAWHVTEGKWDGVSLAGLTVVGAIKARATLGDPYNSPYPAKSVLFVDQRATAQQRQALINFAQEMGGELLHNVVHVVDTQIDMEVLAGHDSRARLQAGNFVTVETRAIGEKDHLCGNESTLYPPLTRTTHAMPAVAMTDQYRGNDLNIVWELHNKRSAFVGTFAR
ncbi:MAG: DUF1326 domain-containing protein [Acidobacteriia bacterium]|nr:DUF1326 domain-containing protein [Terriglobia bacterium]